MSSNDYVPAVPDATAIAKWAGVARTILSGLAGMGLLTGLTISDAQMSAIVAMVMVVSSLVLWAAVGIWSWWQKHAAQRQLFQAAEASASKRKPVQPAEPPPPP